ncbi:related to SSZ1 - regulator protein involved in pleiotropic drug resistance [Melanopsichium pennsylvanicum]|uniref:Related to SSZ1 - regulator protein involved in pleiotropic drug resistance n=2 Tax=Melanopsichium pennsylvanicum TaxID=63383 RepID=A0AAJ5C8F1_9BASI|nr:related to SSZ1-regulator protein involved in pleiotropic drug resistance [Melanopsichium pennsylvanicum 4]SNX87434.1 related to SSZ1 - regulator protein involved in pleiotropic drug resistance [Melanopsichium pennsylvanicum]
MSESAGAVIGINFGHSYSSIACINQHGRADVIANEDGERQLATRIAYNGDQVYLANQATPQLVRNAPNVIDNFVNLLGRPFSTLTDAEKKRASAPVIDLNGTPGFNVEIDNKPTTLTVHDVSVRFLRSLFLTAKDFLSGVPIAGAVLSVPQWFPQEQISALKTAAQEAGLIVLQVIPASAATLAAYGLTSPAAHAQLPAHPDGVDSAPYPVEKALDRNVVVVDMGGSSTDITVLSARSGLYTTLAYSHHATLGGTTLDSALINFFAKEFTKKTKITIADTDKRAWAKLRNEAEFTKRALSASNSATCSVESLAEGVDFTGSVNRMRFDMLAGPAFGKVVANVEECLNQAGLEACQVDEVVLAGGSARLTGLADRLSGLFGDADEGGANITASIDADQVIARGCAIQAQVIAAAPQGSKESEYIHKLPHAPVDSVAEFKVQTTSAPVGLVLAHNKFVTLIPAHTPFPLRRSYRFPVAKGAETVAFTLDEGVDEVKTETIQPEEEEELEEDDEPLEPEVVKTSVTKATGKGLASFIVPTPAKGGKKVELELIMTNATSLEISAKEEGAKECIKIAL